MPLILYMYCFLLEDKMSFKVVRSSPYHRLIDLVLRGIVTDGRLKKYKTCPTVYEFSNYKLCSTATTSIVKNKH